MVVQVEPGKEQLPIPYGCLGLFVWQFAHLMAYAYRVSLERHRLLAYIDYPGEVSELADEHDLGSCAARRGGSSPPFPT